MVPLHVGLEDIQQETLETGWVDLVSDFPGAQLFGMVSSPPACRSESSGVDTIDYAGLAV